MCAGMGLLEIGGGAHRARACICMYQMHLVHLPTYMCLSGSHIYIYNLEVYEILPRYLVLGRYGLSQTRPDQVRLGRREREWTQYSLHSRPTGYIGY